MQQLQDIESSIHHIYATGGHGSVSFFHENDGYISVDSTAEKWYTVLRGRFSNISRDLYFTVERNVSYIMMYFQLRGTSTFISGSEVKVQKQTHSLNYLQEVRFAVNVEKGTEEEYFCVKIFPELLLQHIPHSEDSPLVKFSGKKEMFITLHCPQVMSPAIHHSIHDYIHCPYKGSIGAAYRDNIILNLLIHQLAAFTDEQLSAEDRPNMKLSKADIDLLNDIRKYLDTNFLEVESLQQVSRKFCVNTFKLKSGFRQLFNHSVMKYVDDHKMNYARTLLQNSDVPVNDVADELGYEHYNNFSTAFKKKFGYSPAAIRY
jgi:AraC-like DNA-binding protein